MSNYDWYIREPSEAEILERNRIANRRDELIEFFGHNAGINLPCPRCGVSLEWNWTRAGNAFAHMDWHKAHDNEVVDTLKEILETAKRLPGGSSTLDSRQLAKAIERIIEIREF